MIFNFEEIYHENQKGNTMQNVILSNNKRAYQPIKEAMCVEK